MRARGRGAPPLDPDREREARGAQALAGCGGAVSGRTGPAALRGSAGNRWRARSGRGRLLRRRLANWVAPSGSGGLAAPDPREGGADFEEGGGWEVGEG